jgi:bis(5'-adenosyl)-triphosphatase
MPGNLPFLKALLLPFFYLYRMTCPFCEPDMKDAVFAESGNFQAIYNIAPIFPGHSLIIPRRHVQSLMELTDDELSEMILFTREVTHMLLREFKAEAFNWSVQDKEAAGQTLTHLHLHIVPRYPGDIPEPGDWYPKVQKNFGEILDSADRIKLTTQELSSIVSSLRKSAGSPQRGNQNE